ncbi:MAG: hypothetical protein GY789_17480 [Hyphomicrobiales bacterium]|nr:hypothetical protein [Hyphomicrobiales bacterium]
MKTKEDVEELERLVGQLQGLHTEISQLTRKTPNDAVNAFKLKLINNVIKAGNSVLGDSYRPFVEFEEFDVDDVPTNSDVTLILGQYMEQTERLRSDNVVYDSPNWTYIVDGEPSGIKAAPPSRIGSKK